MNLTSDTVVIVHMYTRVVCPNFGHPALTSSFTKHTYLKVINIFITILNEPSVLHFFSFRMVIYYFRSMPTAPTKCVNLE